MINRVARCPVFNRTIRYFGSLSGRPIGLKMTVIPDNGCVNNSIFCATDAQTASVRYSTESHLATLLINEKLHFRSFLFGQTLKTLDWN